MWPNIADPHFYLDLHRSGIDDMVEYMWHLWPCMGTGWLRRICSSKEVPYRCCNMMNPPSGLSVINSTQFLLPENWM
jgi:hypothetical protein